MTTPRTDRDGLPAVGVGSAEIARVRALSTLLDNAITIPGLGVRVGLDPLLGLVPGLGDLLGAGVSGYIVLVAARAGASSGVLTRMVGNIAIDTLVGAVPAVGDLFDFAWKSNARNVALLERHIAEPEKVRRSSAAIVLVLAILLALLAAGGIALAWVTARWLVSRLNGTG